MLQMNKEKYFFFGSSKLMKLLVELVHACVWVRGREKGFCIVRSTLATSLHRSGTRGRNMHVASVSTLIAVD